MVKVTMNLTELDNENASFIQRYTGLRYKAEAVSRAMSLFRFIIEKLRSAEGVELAFVFPDGRCDRVVMPELEQARRAEVQHASESGSR
jgi:hypothetical protein